MRRDEDYLRRKKADANGRAEWRKCEEVEGIGGGRLEDERPDCRCSPRQTEIEATHQKQ